MRPFISVTALVASSGEEKHTKPKPLLRPPSVITLALVMVPNGENSLRRRSSSSPSSRFFTYRLTPCVRGGGERAETSDVDGAVNVTLCKSKANHFRYVRDALDQ